MTPQEISDLPYRPGVGIMLANPRGKVFVGRRIDTETPAWQMPQGGVDSGETPQDAALRELEEETGVPGSLVSIEAETSDWITYDLPHEIVPRIWKGRYRGQRQKWFLMRFQGTDADIRIDTAHPEFSDWRWLAPDDLVAHIVAFKRDLYSRILQDFRDRI